MANKQPNIWVIGMLVSQMGLAFVATLVMGVWLDRKLETNPVFAVLGLILGLAACVLLLVRLVKMTKQNHKEGDKK